MRVLARPVLAAAGALVATVLSLPVLIAGVPLWAVALATRLLAHRLEPRVTDWRALFAFDPELGWRVKGGIVAHCLERRDDVFRVETDADGWPGRGTVAESQMVVGGDSHAFGYGVDPERFFARQVRGVRIKAVGVPGYNLVQELLLMRRLAPALRGKVVVWFVYPGNDLYDNLSPEMNGYRAPFVRREPDGRWTIVTRHLSPEPWRASTGRRGRFYLPTLAALHAPTPLAARAYEAAAALLAEGREVCRRAGADLVVMTIPSPLALSPRGLARLAPHLPADTPPDPEFPDRMIGEACAQLGLPFVALRTVLRREHYKPDDDHWTEEGHRVVAGVLAELHRRRTAPPVAGLVPVAAAEAAP
jgi:hypothetical protein